MLNQAFCFLKENISIDCFQPQVDDRSLCRVCSPSQPPEDVLHVGVVSARLGDGDAQLGVAQRPDGRDDAGDDPDDQGHAHGAGVLHHALRADEDTRADDVAWRREGGREGGQGSVLGTDRREQVVFAAPGQFWLSREVICDKLFKNS